MKQHNQTQTGKRCARTMILCGEYDVDRKPGIVAAGRYLKSEVKDEEPRPKLPAFGKLEVIVVLVVGILLGIAVVHVMAAKLFS